MIQAYIVDDEAPARNELKRFLSTERDFKLVGEAQDGEEAIKGIKRALPRVVFLDIHMPSLNGLEVAQALSELPRPPLVVFVTAYDEHAIQAFELNAMDYILKPYDEDRFKSTCDKVRRSLLDQVLVKERLSSLHQFLEHGRPAKILGHKRNSRERIFIQPESVLFFHVQLTEVTAHIADGETLLVNATLKALIDMLDPNQFQQAHRSYIVNLNQVEKVIPQFSGNFKLVMKDPARTTIPLSRRYAKKLKQYLKW